MQLKVDTGLSRNGAPRERVAGPGHRRPVRARTRARSGSPGCGRTSPAPTSRCHPANAAQQEAFEEALALATDAGLEPEVRHLANSAGALLHPSARYDLVRVGIAVYGFSPAPDVVTHRAARAGPGDDGPRDRRTHQGDRGRRRRLLRPHLRGRGADAGGAGADGVRRRHPAPRLQHRRGARQRRARPGARPGLHGPVRGRRPRGARRRRGGAVRPGVSRRAHRDRLGPVVRDHRLRDRHPDGWPPDPRLGRGRGRASEHPSLPGLRGRRSRRGRAGRRRDRGRGRATGRARPGGPAPRRPTGSACSARTRSR